MDATVKGRLAEKSSMRHDYEDEIYTDRISHILLHPGQVGLNLEEIDL
ncbi:hypothetical protein [Sphingobacterium mizutaii]|nr:hypothetical protein [Sphingobacterium mizutaii]